MRLARLVLDLLHARKVSQLWLRHSQLNLLAIRISLRFIRPQIRRTRTNASHRYLKQNKRGHIDLFYFALGAIRTRDLSLKRGVLYLLSYKRIFYLILYFGKKCFLLFSYGVFIPRKINLARTNFIVNSFFLFFLTNFSELVVFSAVVSFFYLVSSVDIEPSATNNSYSTKYYISTHFLPF